MAELLLAHDDAIFFAESIKSLSGNILSSGSPVMRAVLVYRNYGTTPYAVAVSDLSGNWAVSVTANNSDRFRVVIVGKTGEYSKIFEDVVAG